MFFFLSFFVNNSKVISRVNLGPIKIVYGVMVQDRSRSEAISFLRVSPFIHSFSSDSGIWCVCVCSLPVLRDNSHWLTVPSLHVTVACRHVKQNDSFTSTYFTLGSLPSLTLLFFFIFWRLEDFLSESLLFGFQDEIITSTLWLMGYSDPFYVRFGISMCLFAYADNR